MKENQGNGRTSVEAGLRKHAGGCHCGAVRFEVEYDVKSGGARCNCSICNRLGATTTIVKPSAFVLLSGKESLATYEWGGKTGQRKFCKVCGVHCFGPGYLEQVGGDYVSVNLNCLDDVDPNDLAPLIYWDGRHNNWQAGPRNTPWPIFTSPPQDARAAAR